MRGELLVVLGAIAGAGCGVKVREARALQPHPVARSSPDVPPASVPLHIYQRHYMLPHIRLGQWAQFVAVSRDRLRFHVGILGPNELEADTRDLEVWLEDEAGRRLACDEREAPRLHRFLAIGRTVFEGVADYVFHEPDLLSRQRRMLTLVVRHAGFEYRYTWTFGDGTEVVEYGYHERDLENGYISVPGPYALYRGTTYEDDR